MISFFVMTSIFLLVGCSGKRHQLFTHHAPTTQNIQPHNRLLSQSHYRIQPYDRLSIVFYEYPELSTKNKDQAESDIGTEVGQRGTIFLPLVGEVAVGGMTKEQLVDILYAKYSKFLEKPALRVEILNQKVYVLGEVTNPGVIELSKNRSVTPLKAIVERGGLTQYAKRDLIKVVRGTREDYQVFDIDLTDFHSIEAGNVPLYPDDIVYVAHNKVKDFNLPLSGADASISWINALFSSLTLYQVYK